MHVALSSHPNRAERKRQALACATASWCSKLLPSPRRAMARAHSLQTTTLPGTCCTRLQHAAVVVSRTALHPPRLPAPQCSHEAAPNNVGPKPSGKNRNVPYHMVLGAALGQATTGWPSSPPNPRNLHASLAKASGQRDGRASAKVPLQAPALGKRIRPRRCAQQGANSRGALVSSTSRHTPTSEPAHDDHVSARGNSKPRRRNEIHAFAETAGRPAKFRCGNANRVANKPNPRSKSTCAPPLRPNAS